MSVLNLITLGGGLALFLYGMNMLGDGLEKMSSGKMEKILEKLTSNIFLSVLLGALITAAIQSSSATTVIVVGMVNAGILKLRNAVGVIMGANIGTTVTAQILRLGDLESSSDSLILTLLKPSTLAPLVAVIGILIYMMAKRPRKKTIGTILIGFGILFQGMFAMEDAVAPLKDSPFFYELFATLQNPFLGVLVGAVVTAVIQSSSASVGILQALSSTGAITFSAAFPIIMGQNIGTCVTSLIAAMGANRNAKRAAMVHLYFNIIGTVLFLAAVYGFNAVTGGFAFWNDAIDKGGIANVHTIFNVVVTI
ncbi:MAG: Na/Pi cotransporter family protein, partial [Oscillospiraceae bacterium]|nr:Na/Pi cotransporter family protein [Oscillospiraceae bacterium]